jgi:hypothetical protein
MTAPLKTLESPNGLAGQSLGAAPCSAILESMLPARPDFGKTQHVSKLIWRWSVRELERHLPDGWDVISSTGIGWFVQYRPNKRMVKFDYGHVAVLRGSDTLTINIHSC